jgi:Tol biopolymer transport system component
MLIAPGGELVIFTRVGDLWSVGVEDKKETQLMDVDAIYALQPIEGGEPRVPYQLGWLPQSQVLLFSTAFNPVEGGPLRRADDLNSYDLASGKVSRLLNDGQGGDFFPSPDGRSIAIALPGSISVMDAGGENLREIFAFEPILTPDASPYYPKLVWTPDSASVLLVLPPRDAANDTAAVTTVWRLPIDGSEPQKLTDVNTNGGPLVISPDQARILYQLNIQAETGSGELHAALIDGSGDTILHNGSPSRLVGWSADSRGYTFRTEADNAILVGELGQTGTTPLSTSPLIYDPAFTPNWVNPSQYLLQAADGVHLGFVGSNTELIAKGSPGTVFFDFTLKTAVTQ